MAKALYCNLIAYFGVPATILSNHGTEFMGNTWSQLQAMIGCRMYHSSPYHPQGNSVIKRSHRATPLEDNRLTWWDVLPVVQLTMNSAEYTFHTFSPAQFILGTDMRLPVDCHLPCAVPKSTLTKKDHVQWL